MVAKSGVWLALVAGLGSGTDGGGLFFRGEGGGGGLMAMTAVAEPKSTCDTWWRRRSCSESF